MMKEKAGHPERAGLVGGGADPSRDPRELHLRKSMSTEKHRSGETASPGSLCSHSVFHSLLERLLT